MSGSRFTVEVAEELGLSVAKVSYYEKFFALGVERRSGVLWWSEEKVQRLKQELARHKSRSVYPRTSEVASRLGIEENEVTMAFVNDLTRLLAEQKVAYDIQSYRDAPAGLRIWCGATVETADVQALLPWLDWAFAETRRHHA